MSRTGRILFAGFLTLAAARGAVATHDDIHAKTIPCTKCHVKTPGPNDTRETAPLIMPAEELCKTCHKQNQ